MSDTRGLYSFPALRSGVYRIEAEAPGFRKLSQPGIEVRSGTLDDLYVTIADEVMKTDIRRDRLIAASSNYLCRTFRDW